MIASIRGRLIFLSIDYAVVETGGIGLQIFAQRPLLVALGEIGNEVMFYTHLIVREDLLALYGFASQDQRHLFETLLGVSGVGPKVALSLLSSGQPDELRAAIANGDVARLSRVPGIGKRTAERMVLDLKGKIDLRNLNLPTNPGLVPVNAELAEMLTSLGFSAAEANAAVASLPADAPPDLEDRLRLALRYFGGA